MKRSKFIEKLSRELYMFHHPINDYDEIAEVFLEFAENEGMLPPGYNKPLPFYEGSQYPLVPGDFLINGIWCTPGQYEWEPEDEKNK